jgi:hypothetical protein
MNVLTEVLLLAALAGPGEPKDRTPSRAGFDALAEGGDDLRRRLTDLGAADADELAEPEAQAKQEEGQKEHPETPLEPPGHRNPPAFDFEWMEVQPRVGVAIFSKNYHISPSPAFGASAHVPLTFLSPSSNPDGEYFGVFAQFDVSIVKRNITPTLDKPQGPIFLATLGADYTIFRNETWLVAVEGGMQYGFFGGITDLENGFAPIAGVRAGVSISRKVSLVLTPEYVIAKDPIILMMLGGLIEF